MSKKVTTATLQSYKRRGRSAVFLTAYDYPTATFAERAGVDMLLVGDSAAMTVLGHSSTVGIGMEEMIVFSKAVSYACQTAFVVGDMPFLSYQVSAEEAIRNAGALVAGGGCDAVKCEGGRRVANRIAAIVDAGIPVMGHIGLTPQNLGQLGGYRVQGKSLQTAEVLVNDALALESAGAFAILVEAVPAVTAALIRERVTVPVYGIGAGPHVDGQLVISHDILGSFVGEIEPRFVKRYADVGGTVEKAFRSYAADVRDGSFPGPEHCYPIPPDEASSIERLLVGKRKQTPQLQETDR